MLPEPWERRWPVAPAPLPSPWVGIGRHLVLLALTSASVWAVGEEAWPGAGWKFAAALLSILFSHEMGHYVACRRYGVDATLPYFLPSPWIPGAVWFPLSFIGTFGAVIRIRGRIPHRRALFDIGVAGPLAGFAVILLLLAIGGVADGSWVPAPPPGAAPGSGGLTLGEPLLFRLAEGAITPRPGMIYMIGPVGLAAWVGMLVTALNLLPVGQLDGGHVVHALFPRHARLVSRAGLVLSLVLLWFRPFWLLWTLLLWTLGRRPHPPTTDESAPVGATRMGVGLLAAVVLVLCFTPSPILVTWSEFGGAFDELLGLLAGWVT